MKDAFLKMLIKVISEQTGLNIREQDRDKFIETVSARIRSLNISSSEEYYHFFKKDNKSKAEWQEITKCLTTGETYFFRDRGQFSLLKFSILPELIELRKDKRTLRIWSAGCSTGEEAYSIAILLNELIPSIKDWDILILGTDINEDALKKARRCYYRDWSFRMVSEDIKKQWFRKAKEGWRLDKNITEMVKFEVGDLINDTYPYYSSAIHNMDLILCRNVFIYFISDVVSKVTSKFNETLNDGGYLMTGHAELPQQAIANLRPKVFPESVVYQKSSELGVRSAGTPILDFGLPILDLKSKFQRPTVAGAPKSKIDEIQIPHFSILTLQSIMSEAKELYNKGNYPLTIEKLEYILLTNPEYFDAHCLIGQTYANIGEYGKAESNLKKAIEIDKFNAEPYYLLAQISRENGRLEDEEEMLKKVIYLNPSHIPAYLEMGIIYEGKGDRERAFKMRNSALNLLKTLPSDERIEPYTELTIEELIRHVQEMLK
ncbi:MAG: tetratricopeptide repeat protein [Nitrospinae bacterium]|nr:tetratricopeptide repeat protein [Nitrospinota bacterium]